MASALHSNCIIRLNNEGGKGIDVTVDYANFMSLDMERIWGDSANKFTLKLLDDTAYEVESILLGGSRNIYMRYYVDDGSNIEYSKEFEGNIWDYSVDFINNMTILTITGTCGVSVKDIYTLYNRLWNKVPVLSEDITTEAISWWNDILTRPQEVIKFRYATTESGEQKFQVSLASVEEDGKEVPLYIDCEMINVPVRPSDIVELIATGGSPSKLSPFSNKDIDYDSFADSGFNFGTYTEGGESKVVNWSTALSWLNQYQNLVLGTSINFLGGTGGANSSDLSLIRRVVASLIVIREYYRSLKNISSTGWPIGHIEKTEPICSDLSQVKMSNTKYISEVLAGKSFTSLENTPSARSNYYLSFKDGKLYFMPATVEAKPNATVVVGQYLNPNTLVSKKSGNNIYTGDMVLSYSYSSNIAAYIAGESSNELAGVSYITGDAISTEGLSASAKENLGVIEASYTGFTEGAITTLGGKSSTSINELVQAARDDWTSIAQTSFKAEVQLLGNTKLECGDYIEIINLPGGKLGRHHTSGIYLIMKIKESISKGVYISTLTLVKNAASSGSGVTVSKYSTANRGKSYTTGGTSAGGSSGGGFR